jgi:tRNA pseudouridine38-40 synthase
VERRNHALKLAYDGTAFAGWQKQTARPTVQQAVEDGLALLLGERVQVHGAARTDAGVHADGQVAGFAVRRAIEPARLAALDVPGVRVLAAAEAAPTFHARASAIGKRYRYRFSWGERRERAFHLGGEVQPRWDLARDALCALAELPHISGLASQSARNRPAPPLEAWELREEGATAELLVRGQAFRKHQIRNLAGHLAAIALGLAAPETLAALAGLRRPWRGATGPGHALTLLEVLYPPALDPFR